MLYKQSQSSVKRLSLEIKLTAACAENKNFEGVSKSNTTF